MNILFPKLLSLLLFVGPVAAVQAQVGFNVSLQTEAQLAVPSPSYSAASAQFGVWNRVAGPATFPGSFPVVYPLVDLAGNPTNVTFSANNTASSKRENLPGTFGDDELLLDQSFVVDEGCAGNNYTLSGLAPGSYSIYLYVYQPRSCPFSSSVGVAGCTVSLGSFCYNLSSTFAEGSTHAICNFNVQPGADIVIDMNTQFGDGETYIQGFQVIPDNALHKIHFCDSTINSTGSMANMVFSGSSSVQANDLRLGVRNLPLNQFGYFLVSWDPGTSVIPPGSQGNLCVGGSIGRHNRIGEVLFSGPVGAVLMDLDLTDIPQPAGPISVMPGEMWHWQYWYRDNNPSSTSNFSDAYRIGFTN